VGPALPLEGQLLLLRGVVLLLLYLFVALVVLVVSGDVRRGARQLPRARRSVLGQLVIVEPGPTGLAAGTSFPLSAVSSIGRGMRNLVSLDDEFLSSEHALLSWRQSSWWLEDLGSTNGTLLNGVRIGRPVPVTTGDIIEVGRVALRLEL